MPPKRKTSTSPSPPSTTFRSAPVTDRLSTFVAHYSPTLSAKALQADPAFADASHRIAAWRIPSKQRVLSATAQPTRQLFETGYDDDGEQYAGKKLEKLLDTMKVEGAVVVARWYGGVLLGPVRFTHIEHVARDAILKSHNGTNVAPQKLQKLDEKDEQLKKEKLESILEQRDNNITTLRSLLAEKKGASSSGAQSPSPAKQLSYGKMSLNALQRLEKVKDATLAWLLQEIDKAEKASKVNEQRPEQQDAVADGKQKAERPHTPEVKE